MKQLSDVEVERARILKAVRTNIRLWYSLKADEKINELLPAIEQEANAALLRGDAYALDIRSVLDALEAEDEA